jgi:uncharacterized membrane protein YgcG
MPRFPSRPLVAFAIGAAVLSLLTVVPTTARSSTTPVGGVRSLEAQALPRLQGSITDEAGVVGDGRAALERALEDLLTRQNVQLYALFVPTTGGEEPSAYAQGTFEQNGLGGNDFLLLVAVDDRRFAWWEESAVPSLTSTEIDQLLARTAEGRFRAGDYAGGVGAFATGLADELAPVPTNVPTPIPSQAGGGGTTSPPSSTGDGGFVAAILGLVLVVLGAIVLWTWWRNRRLSRLTVEERDRRTGELAREANALLIQADDAVREADQELGFAEAQFDEADIAPLRDAIASARQDLKAAFAVRQKLDDEIPDEPSAREAMLSEIVARTRRIVALLEAQRQRLEKLRAQEQAAPQTLSGLPTRIDVVAARVPATETAFEHLHAYAPATWNPVEGNLTEAHKRLAAATDQVRIGGKALASAPPQTSAAATAARRAERALGEATDLLDAIDRLAATIADARTRLDPEIVAAQQDIESARAASSARSADPDLAQRIAAADDLLSRARQEAASPAPDVLGALKDAQAAHQAADAILASVRDSEARAARERAALAAAIRSAEANLAGANDFIATRRPGVGREARTRLATAQTHLDSARSLASSEPTRALEEAGLADRLAAESYRLAQSDFDQWDRPGPRPTDDLGRVILGGIILGNILGGMGGGRRGGGWGGTPWGMPGGGGRGGGGSWAGLGRGGGGRGGSGSW